MKVYWNGSLSQVTHKPNALLKIQYADTGLILIPNLLCHYWIKKIKYMIIMVTSQTDRMEVFMKLRVGNKAPDFMLKSHLDKEVTLSYLHGKTVVLAFFPMAWTPI